MPSDDGMPLASAVTTRERKRIRSRPAAPARPRRVLPVERAGVVHVAAECWPFARTGGLGEAVSGLAAAQHAAGIPTTIVLPLYRSVRETWPGFERVGPPLAIPLGGARETVFLYRLTEPAAGPRVYFVEHPDFFDRPGIYGDDGQDYPDNARRFALLSLAALAAIPEIAPEARVLHAHDWHAALAPVYLRTRFASRLPQSDLAAVLTVHNAGFQGQFPAEAMRMLDLPWELFTADAFEWYGRTNLLKGGLAFADAVTTVSPSHARELCTPEGGFGLHETFAALGGRLAGVLNGIDAAAWDPAADPHIPARYSARALAGKARCKTAVQETYGLARRPDAPLFAMSARLVEQKGLDLILGADLLAVPHAQFVFLGSGEHRYHHALEVLAAAAPERVAVEFAFTDRLEHRLLAGADLLLMPSLYEPCGLTQMRAQRYGTIPVARAVGGLRDTIRDGVTGFLFDEYESAALARAVRRALEHRADADAWRAMMRTAMAQRFGWEDTVAAFEAVYGGARAARALAQ